MSEMLAVHAQGSEIGLRRVPVPEPGPGDVRIAVEACGLCGSDLHLRTLAFYPGITPGHEFTGRVSKLGPAVEGVAVGDRVAVEPFRTCGRCPECLAGADPRCPEAQLFGVHADGGMAEAAVVPAMRCFALPDGLAPRIAALAEPTAVAVRGLARLGALPGRLLVLGAGSIGLLSALVARRAGVNDVHVTARHEHQRALALEMGATRVLREDEATPEAIGAARYDAVIETVGGSADTLVAAGAAVRPGGTVSVLGIFVTSPPIDPLTASMKEVSFAFAYCYHHGAAPEFARAVALLGEERERVARLATHSLPLSEGPRAWDLAASKRDGLIKLSVLPEASS